jgi:hypothetical protein
MTPQERTLVTALFDRLASLEATRRDPEAERLIAEGGARAPNAMYALVQTVLLQDEALKRAETHIRELERTVGSAAQDGGFLDTARNQTSGRGSVPSVPSSSKWNLGRTDIGAAPASTTQPSVQEPMGRGGSFLGTAAAAAVGVIGGSMLFNGLHNLMGGGQAHAFGAPSDDNGARSPWDNDASRGQLARDAGLNDIGGGRASRDDTQPAGLFDSQVDSDDLFSDADDGIGGDPGDFGGTDT